MRFFDDYNKAFPAAPVPAETQQAPASGSITRKDLEDLTNAIKESILNDLRSSQDNLKQDIPDQIKAGAPADTPNNDKKEE
jgi:hypothetical protein